MSLDVWADFISARQGISILYMRSRYTQTAPPDDLRELFRIEEDAGGEAAALPLQVAADPLLGQRGQHLQPHDQRPGR